jgi:putative hydrolase of the HAD superfamily
MTNNIKVVLFDLDNTLIDRQSAAVKLMKDMILEDFPEGSYSDEYRSELLDKLYEWDYEGHTPKEFSFGKYIEFTNIKERDWEYYNHLWEKRLKDYTELFAKSIETLEYLKDKYRLALLTNGSIVSQQGKLDMIDINDYFEEIVISGTYQIHKPDKRIFQIVLDKLNVLPHEVVYVGDGLVNDVQGALSMGMKAIWQYPYPDVDTDEACQRIYRVEDLKIIL